MLGILLILFHSACTMRLVCLNCPAVFSHSVISLYLHILRQVWVFKAPQACALISIVHSAVQVRGDTDASTEQSARDSQKSWMYQHVFPLCSQPLVSNVTEMSYTFWLPQPPAAMIFLKDIDCTVVHVPPCCFIRRKCSCCCAVMEHSISLAIQPAQGVLDELFDDCYYNTSHSPFSVKLLNTGVNTEEQASWNYLYSAGSMTKMADIITLGMHFTYNFNATLFLSTDFQWISSKWNISDNSIFTSTITHRVPARFSHLCGPQLHCPVKWWCDKEMGKVNWAHCHVAIDSCDRSLVAFKNFTNAGFTAGRGDIYIQNVS